jgi:uncharacterized membrane protein
MTMDLLEGHAKGVKDYGLERLIMLSDGVFAIAITLLALEIRPPEGWDRTFNGLLGGMWRELLAFTMSFATIAIYWASHRRTFQRFRRSDAGLTAINFVLLGLITLLPFASRLIAEGGPRGEPFMIYLGFIAAIGLANALLWGWAAFVAGVIDAHTPMGVKIVVMLILLLVPTMMTAAGLVAGDPTKWWVLVLAGSICAVLIGLRRVVGRHEKAA